MLGFGLEGVLPVDDPSAEVDPEEESSAFLVPTPDRLQDLARALERGISAQRITEATGIDRWFIQGIANVLRLEQAVRDRAAQAPPARPPPVPLMTVGDCCCGP